jgi:hypothetical protein
VDTAAILLALQTWTAKTPERDRADLEPWASAIAGVCMTPRECTELAALAFEETGMVRYAVDEDCNDRSWRVAHHVERWGWPVCDAGTAFGPWQIHDERLRGATPELQASVALSVLRRAPECWTTWKRARDLAARWLARHP